MVDNKVSLLLVYILPTSKVISAWVPTCHRAHSWQLYSAALLGDQTSNTMTHPTQSHYPDTEPTSLSLPYPNNAERLTRKLQVSVLKSVVSLDQTREVQIPRSPKMGCSTHQAISSSRLKRNRACTSNKVAYSLERLPTPRFIHPDIN